MNNILSKHPHLAIIVHLLVLGIVAVLGSYLNLFHFNIHTIEQAPWDASWYMSIAINGYWYQEGVQSNTAFFPLFPLVWRWLHINTYGISIFNLVLYVVSLVILIRTYRLSFIEGLFVASSFAMFYCWLPFSEAVFLLPSVVALYGIKNNNNGLAFAGILLAALSRSAALVFMPALFMVALYRWLILNTTYKEVLKQWALLSFACVLSIVIVVLIQWYDTGLWFIFGKSQLMWHKKLQWPSFPLKSWDNFKVLILDAAALFAGIMCTFLLLQTVLTGSKQKSKYYSPEYIFALCYLAGVVLLAIAFGVQNETTTFINSLNRYVFCTAFFMVYSIYQIRKDGFSKPEFVFWGMAVLFTLYATGYFENPYDVHQLSSARLDAIGISTVTLLFTLLSVPKMRPVLLTLFYGFQTVLQLHFWELYLKTTWVG